MFGQGCEVETVEMAYRYCLGAKIALRNWSKHRPLPRLFSDQSGRLRRKSPRQPLAPEEAKIREVFGMIIPHDGEFKLWQPEWNRPGPAEPWASLKSDTWKRVESPIGDDTVHSQLRRGRNHAFSSVIGPDLASSSSTMRVSNWRRECLIVSLPQFFLMKRDDFSAAALFEHWLRSETVIAAKSPRGTKRKR